MEQTVYGDIFFLVNFSMDFLCLFLSAKLLSRRVSPVRLLLASALGGVYALGALFFSFGHPWALLADLGAGVGISALALGRRRGLGELPLCAVVFTAVSMGLGGCMTALFHLFNRLPFLRDLGEGEGDGLSVWAFALLALISGVLTLAGGRLFARRSGGGRGFVTLRYRERSVRLSAMTDSGNLLRDPVSGRACMLADVHALKGLLPDEILREAAKSLPDPTAVSPRYRRDLRLIPVRTASGDGLRLAVRGIRVAVEGRRGSVDTDLLVVLCRLEGADGSQALLPPTVGSDMRETRIGKNREKRQDEG